MAKYPTFVLAVLLFFSNCFADTFMHRRTGESFNGYVTQIKKGDKTKIFIEKGKPQYIDLGDYEIRYNYLGRKNKVLIFSIKDSVELICETEAFEKAIVTAANQGSLFILIDIDAPGGRIDLVRRISEAITKIHNCRTVAFVSGGRFGGAFSAGAVIALACDKVYMREGTAIGAAYVEPSSGAEPRPSEGLGETIEEVYGREAGAEFDSQWLSYVSAIAEQNDRPVLLVKAMVDKDIEVIEVLENGERLLIDPKDKKPTQTVVGTASEKGALLRLTAAQAAQFGIADKVVASQDELFAGLAATMAKQVSDNNVLRARRKFERGRRTIDRTLASVSSLEERAAAIVSEINIIEVDISRIHRLGSFDREGIPRGYYRYSREENELRRLVEYYNNLSNRLVNVLNDLIRDYERALEVANMYPDLSDYVSTLERSLESAEAEREAKSKGVRFRSR